jgi:hypothetical protein
LTQMPSPGPLFALADSNVRRDDVMRLSGQTRQVAAALQRGERIGMEWADLHQVKRLAARIKDLRDAGWVIRSERDPATKCAVYWMEVGK